MQEMLIKRLALTRQSMHKNKVDGLLVFTEENRRYLSGFTGEDHQFDETAGVLVITQGYQALITDPRFELQAAREAPGFDVVIYRKNLFESIASYVADNSVTRLGLESVRLTVHLYGKLQDAVKQVCADGELSLVPLEGLVEDLRVVKNEKEIEKTRRAVEVAETGFRQAIKGLKTGMSEKEMAWLLERCVREAGADDISFPVIVAAGPNSALPHAIPTDRKIAAGEPVLFDWGVKLDGYCSDASRTVIIGPPDDTFLKVHGTVLEAQQRATAAVKSGISGKAVDTIARDFIHKNGYEGKFGHGLGHGTGLAIHEAPRLSQLRDDILKSGMIVTVEPGVYLPDWGGVRIENQVVVADAGPVVLNRLSTTYDIAKI